MKNVKLTWHGHSCFTLEEDGYRIVLDPYADNYVPGFGPLRLEADEVLCSHGHNDHSAAKCVKLRKGPAGKNPFRITEIHSFHDDAKGKKRGANTIRIFDDGEYRIAHMGDIGCMPSAEQKEQLRGIDVMLMPVGGFFTLEPSKVHELVRELAPKMLVPMHYKGDGFGYEMIAPLEAYTSLCGDVVRMEGNVLSLPEDAAAGTVVLVPPVRK